MARLLMLSAACVLAFALISVPSYGYTARIYWQENQCWQAGSLGSESFACDNAASPGYLSTHMINDKNRVEDFLEPAGHYCSYFGISDSIDKPEEEKWELAQIPLPRSNYQEGDDNGDNCAAWSSGAGPLIWGLEMENIPGSQVCEGTSQTCEMQSYFSLPGLDDRPWASYFRNPELDVYTVGVARQFKPNAQGQAWGFLCPVLEDASSGNIIELCFEEWRGYGESAEGGPYWQFNHVAECNKSRPGFEHSFDRLVVHENVSELDNIFGEPIENFEEEYPSGIGFGVNTGVTGGAWESYVQLDNEQFETSRRGRPGEPEAGAGCGRNSSLNPANWVLVGVANGQEQWEASAVTTELDPSLVSTAFEPHPIEITSENATEVTETQAKISGAIDPYGFETKYVVQYGGGKETGEFMVPESGTSSVPVSTVLPGLLPNTTYTYRIEALRAKSEVGEPVYGEYKTFKTEPAKQCSGSDIAGLGSSFQDPAQIVWTTDFNGSGEPPACNGTQGSGGTPKVKYLQGAGYSGSGACLRALGAEGGSLLYGEVSFCGTDEAPNKKQREEIESHLVSAQPETLETIPVLQGSVAVLVHLPEGCKASSEIIEKEKTYKLGRLVFDDVTLEGIYAGTIDTWKEAIAAQKGDGNDALSCVTKSEEEETINRVVRADHSGTTHIFKAFLGQVATGHLAMEPYAKEYSGSSTGCGVEFPAEEKTWTEVDEGCANQRWSSAAHVIRPSEAGDVAVIDEVAHLASSVGYAGLADTREQGSFSRKGLGGENKKGSETKTGEQNTRFWAMLQSSPSGETPVTYADPGTKDDVEAAASSNCKNTRYLEAEGKEFPPPSTRELWNQAVASIVQENYPLCGVIYDLALREYKPYLWLTTMNEVEIKAMVMTVENYLEYEVNSKGGAKEIKNKDYEALPKEVLKESERGIKELGYIPCEITKC